MDWIFVKHAEAQQHIGPVHHIDAPVTDAGMRQACLTAVWLNYNLNLKNFHGFTSPSWASLQTASAISITTELEFDVNSNLRDFSKDKIEFENRSMMFQNLQWNAKDWHDGSRTYDPETGEELVARCQKFIEENKDRHEGVIVVSHNVPCIVLSELVAGADPSLLATKCDNLLKTTTEPIKPGLEHDKLVSLLEKQVFLTKMKNCGLTLVSDGKPMWLSKVVYE